MNTPNPENAPSSPNAEQNALVLKSSFDKASESLIVAALHELLLKTAPGQVAMTVIHGATAGAKLIFAFALEAENAASHKLSRQTDKQRVRRDFDSVTAKLRNIPDSDVQRAYAFMRRMYQVEDSSQKEELMRAVFGSLNAKYLETIKTFSELERQLQNDKITQFAKGLFEKK